VNQSTSLPDVRLVKKICVLGSFAAGKSSLVRRFVENTFDEKYLTTVGVKLEKKRLSIGPTEIEMILWDLAGDDELEQTKPSYFRSASGYILVVDGCRQVTIPRALAMHRRAASVSGPVPVVVAFNKTDLRHEWEVNDADYSQMVGNEWPCVHTSAKTGQGVDHLFLALAQRMLAEMSECPR
jgi:hypothetical protein